MGFLPPNASNIERGPGFVAYDKGDQAHIVFTSYRQLSQQVTRAIRYASRHGGDLPKTAFWNTTADVYDDNVRLFAREHQCGPLLRLLRRDEAFDRANPGPQMLPPVLPPVLPPAPLTPTGPTSPGTVVGSVSPLVEAVPEPATGGMVGLGLLVLFVVARRGSGRRAASA